MTFLYQKSGLFLVISAFLIALTLPACGYSGSNKCDDDCECTGSCNDRDYADCVDTEEWLDDLADNAGCADQRAAYLDCYGGQFRCVNRFPDASGCGNEWEAWQICVKK